jgi:CDP-glucose 4,6-dehydratase
MLDITKAGEQLGWKPYMTTKECIRLTADWYMRYKTADVYKLCLEEIDKYIG